MAEKPKTEVHMYIGHVPLYSLVEWVNLALGYESSMVEEIDNGVDIVT